MMLAMELGVIAHARTGIVSDLVYSVSPEVLHAPVAVLAMRQVRPASVEVPAAFTAQSKRLKPNMNIHLLRRSALLRVMRGGVMPPWGP